MKKVMTLVMVLGLGLSGCSASSAPESDMSQPASDAEASNGAAPAVSAAGKSKIHAELEETGRRLVSQAARTVQPSKAKKNVRKVGKEYVATYTEVDQQSMTTDIRNGSQGSDGYVGFIRYQEVIFECRGASQSAALSAPCQSVKTRRVNEMLFHDGKKWVY